MELSDILLLGDERLYQVCEPVEHHELPDLLPVAEKMAGLILKFRERYGAGRAIAAPQVGLMKRLIVMNIDRPVFFFNPVITERSPETFEMWDNCMSFPNLLVKLKRHRRIRLEFHDANWQPQVWDLQDDLSELLQHEYDHLDGILAISRALDERSLKWKAG